MVKNNSTETNPQQHPFLLICQGISAEFLQYLALNHNIEQEWKNYFNTTEYRYNINLGDILAVHNSFPAFGGFNLGHPGKKIVYSTHFIHSIISRENDFIFLFNLPPTV